MNTIFVIALTVFCVCAALIAFAYAGYPALLWLVTRALGRRGEPAFAANAELPTVSLLVAAYNEQACIGERIENALKLDYPDAKLEIVVATDGCTDHTDEIVRGSAVRGVRLFRYPKRRGKATVLNESIPMLTGEIVVLSDANTFTDSDAMRRLVRWFQDPKVGVVCGRLILTDPETGRNADSLYWRYETFLKKCEGQLGALLGANGGIYALRRDLFTPIPNDTTIDDFVIPLAAKLRTGCQIVYDRSAVAREDTPPDIGCEFHRRARIGAGGFQSIGMLWRLLDPRLGWVAFTFLCHKILRWLCPFLLVGMLISNLWLLDVAPFREVLALQGLFYALSVLMAFVPVRVRLLRPLLLTTMFTWMNLALLLGFWRWLWGTQKGAWRRTARVSTA